MTPRGDASIKDEADFFFGIGNYEIINLPDTQSTESIRYQVLHDPILAQFLIDVTLSNRFEAALQKFENPEIENADNAEGEVSAAFVDGLRVTRSPNYEKNKASVASFVTAAATDSSMTPPSMFNIDSTLFTFTEITATVGDSSVTFKAPQKVETNGRRLTSLLKLNGASASPLAADEAANAGEPNLTQNSGKKKNKRKRKPKKSAQNTQEAGKDVDESFGEDAVAGGEFREGTENVKTTEVHAEKEDPESTIPANTVDAVVEVEVTKPTEQLPVSSNESVEQLPTNIKEENLETSTIEEPSFEKMLVKDQEFSKSMIPSQIAPADEQDNKKRSRKTSKATNINESTRINSPDEDQKPFKSTSSLTQITPVDKSAKKNNSLDVSHVDIKKSTSSKPVVKEENLTHSTDSVSQNSVPNEPGRAASDSNASKSFEPKNDNTADDGSWEQVKPRKNNKGSMKSTSGSNVVRSPKSKASVVRTANSLNTRLKANFLQPPPMPTSYANNRASIRNQASLGDNINMTQHKNQVAIGKPISGGFVKKIETPKKLGNLAFNASNFPELPTPQKQSSIVMHHPKSVSTSRKSSIEKARVGDGTSSEASNEEIVIATDDRATPANHLEKNWEAGHNTEPSLSIELRIENAALSVGEATGSVTSEDSESMSVLESSEQPTEPIKSEQPRSLTFMKISEETFIANESQPNIKLQNLDEADKIHGFASSTHNDPKQTKIVASREPACDELYDELQNHPEVLSIKQGSKSLPNSTEGSEYGPTESEASRPRRSLSDPEKDVREDFGREAIIGDFKSAYHLQVSANEKGDAALPDQSIDSITDGNRSDIENGSKQNVARSESQVEEAIIPTIGDHPAHLSVKVEVHTARTEEVGIPAGIKDGSETTADTSIAHSDHQHEVSSNIGGNPATEEPVSLETHPSDSQYSEGARPPFVSYLDQTLHSHPVHPVGTYAPLSFYNMAAFHPNMHIPATSVTGPVHVPVQYGPVGPNQFFSNGWDLNQYHRSDIINPTAADNFECIYFSCTYCTQQHHGTPAKPAILCPGCSTGNDIQYCSAACLLADALDHAAICTQYPEHAKNVPNFIPLYYIYYPDFIVPGGCDGTPKELHRQQAFSIFCASGPFPNVLKAWAIKSGHLLASSIRPSHANRTGEYHIFKSRASGPQIEQNPNSTVVYTIKLGPCAMKEALKRCLNVSFYIKDPSVIEFLYRLIRYLLTNRFEPAFSTLAQHYVLEEFKSQFLLEFGFTAVQQTIQSDILNFNQEWNQVYNSLLHLEYGHPVLQRLIPYTRI